MTNIQHGSSIHDFAVGATMEVTEVMWVERIRQNPNNVDVAETRHHTGGAWSVQRWMIDYDQPEPSWRIYPEGPKASPLLSNMLFRHE